MQYSVDAPPVRSLDVAGTETVNTGAYASPNCRLRLNGQGLPIAIRRSVSIGKPGSFATQRYQVVAPRKVVSLSHSSLKTWDAHPVN